MKSLKTLASLIVLAFFVGIAPAFAAEVTLSLSDKGGGVVDVVVNDSSNVLGVAFTVNYDSTKLSQPTVTSTYFETFTALELSPATVDSYDSPLVTNETTGATINSLKISAARPTAESTIKTLFTITFSIVTGATGTANVSIVPTTMGAVAGYSAGDQIPVVVGYESSTETYPVLLSSVSLSKDISTQEYLNGDFNGDGMITIVDAVYTYQASLGQRDKNSAKGNCDINNDGMFTIVDAVYIYQCSLGVRNCNP